MEQESEEDDIFYEPCYICEFQSHNEFYDICLECGRLKEISYEYSPYQWNSMGIRSFFTKNRNVYENFMDHLNKLEMIYDGDVSDFNDCKNINDVRRVCRKLKIDLENCSSIYQKLVGRRFYMDRQKNTEFINRVINGVEVYGKRVKYDYIIYKIFEIIDPRQLEFILESHTSILKSCVDWSTRQPDERVFQVEFNGEKPEFNAEKPEFNAPISYLQNTCVISTIYSQNPCKTLAKVII